MTDDQLFRGVVVAFVVLVFPIGVYHRIKSQATGETLDRRREGMFVLATLRPLGAATWLGLFAWMIQPRWMAWSSVALPVPVRWLGVALLVLASALMIWVFRSLGSNLTDTVVTRQQHTLVLHGPYRWIRHPLYTTVVLLSVSIALIAANWYLVLTGVLTFIVLVIRTATEERNLLARFGAGYQSYMDRTGRFLPRVDL